MHMRSGPYTQGGGGVEFVQTPFQDLWCIKLRICSLSGSPSAYGGPEASLFEVFSLCSKILVCIRMTVCAPLCCDIIEWEVLYLHRLCSPNCNHPLHYSALGPGYQVVLYITVTLSQCNKSPHTATPIQH